MSSGLPTTSLVLADMYADRAFSNSFAFVRLLAPNEISDTFLNLSNAFDDLDNQLSTICALFQGLDIPEMWLQSPLFNWKQVCLGGALGTATACFFSDEHEQRRAPSIPDELLHREQNHNDATGLLAGHGSSTNGRQ